ncbi:SRPBCC domain-containing protein [Kineosporia sp. J2-2]|uniref:SRPBCC domain-containing protein n=1 Tax=Kineosporia corallincola TaxID=2835133 RepID=A0ABS5TDU6_9ACTN|nr:SRPBCC domain-containing protein [Kineosporia corallincola]MBT0769246.1 SRPBCC domain-containing protein [Kineosporia corallincola]
MSAFVQLGRVEAGLPPAVVDEDDVPHDRLVFVRKIFPGSAGHVWQALVSPEGTQIWLGQGAVLLGSGQGYLNEEGDGGIVRSFHPLEQLRLTWHSGLDQDTSLVEIDLTPVAGGTRLRLWHEGLQAALRQTMQDQWEHRLDDFGRVCL